MAMRRNGYRALVLVMMPAVLLGAVAQAATPEARRMSAYTCGDRNCTKLGQWEWLYRPNAVFLWEFKTDQLAGCDATRVHLNFLCLMTDQLKQTSGMAADVRFVLELPNGRKTTAEVDMVNPFQPKSPTSRYVGCDAFGASQAIDAAFVGDAIRYGRMKAYLFWPQGIPENMKVGVNKASLQLGFIR